MLLQNTFTLEGYPGVMETDIILPPDSLDDENGNCKRCGHPFTPISSLPMT